MSGSLSADPNFAQFQALTAQEDSIAAALQAISNRTAALDSGDVAGGNSGVSQADGIAGQEIGLAASLRSFREAVVNDPNFVLPSFPAFTFDQQQAGLVDLGPRLQSSIDSNEKELISRDFCRLMQ